MSESLLVALISGFCTLAGSCAGVLASSRLTQYRLAQLEKRVAQHNNLIERTYRLEHGKQHTNPFPFSALAIWLRVMVLD